MYKHDLDEIDIMAEREGQAMKFMKNNNLGTRVKSSFRFHAIKHRNANAVDNFNKLFRE